MINLTDKDTGAALGSITEEQLKFLADQLEEESGDDQDYYINKDTIDMFEEADGDPALISTLRNALDGREEMEIVWSRA